MPHPSSPSFYLAAFVPKARQFLVLFAGLVLALLLSAVPRVTPAPDAGGPQALQRHVTAASHPGKKAAPWSLTGGRASFLAGNPLVRLATFFGKNGLGAPHFLAGGAIGIDPLILAWSSAGADSTKAVAWGDFDGNGALDLAVANYNQPVRIYRNDGVVGGVPQMTLVWSAASVDYSTSLAWGDYNKDGALDLAVGNGCLAQAPFTCYPNRLYRNDGVVGGVLQMTLVWSSAETDATNSVAWGDYDGDGYLDLAVGNGCLPKPSTTCYPSRIYHNEGGTTLSSSAVWSSAEVGQTASVAWADFDRDGTLDLALGNTDQPNRLYRNDGVVGGIPQMTLVWSAASIENTSSLAWGDYNGDGLLDLAVGTFNQPNHLYRNDGVVGGLPQMTLVWSSVETDTTRSVAWGDYDGNGTIDLAVGNSLDQPNRLYRNDNGVLTTSAVWSSPETDQTFGVAWGDYDGDGQLDLAVGNGGIAIGQPNRLYHNTGGALTTNAVWSSAESAPATSVAWGDYDGNGLPDLAVGNGCLNSPPFTCYPVRLYHNDGGVLTAGAVYSTAEVGPVTSLAWGDINGDGKLDLAVGSGCLPQAPYTCYPTRVYRNDGVAGGAPQFTLVWSSTETGPTTSLAWGDYDGNGTLDLAVGNGCLAQVPYTCYPTRLYRNDSGTLTASAVYSTPEPGATQSVAWGDYDRNGTLDLAVGNGCLPQVSTTCYPTRLYRNDGVVGGVPQMTLVWSSAETGLVTSLAWGDYDGDGYLDLAVATYGGPKRLYHNSGGTLSPSAVWSSVEADYTTSIAWGDFNGDGSLDLAVGNFGKVSSQPNRLYRNDGGVLTPNAVWSSAESDFTNSIAWGDFDGDGALDLAAANSGQPIRLYHNLRGASLSPAPPPRVTVSRPGPAANADFYSTSEIWSGPTIPISYTLLDPRGNPVRAIRASYSPDGGGQWLPAITTSNTVTTNLGAAAYFTQSYTNSTAVPIASSGPLTPPITITSTLLITQPETIADIIVHLNLSHTADSELAITLTAPFSRSVQLVNQRGSGANFADTIFDDEAPTSIVSGTAPFTGRFRPERPLSTLDGLPLNGAWTLTIADMYPPADGGQLNSWGITFTLNSGRVYTYNWDIAASNFFGQSDDVVFRIEAIPSITNTANATPGPFLYGSYSSETFPFRVRGTQVRVMQGSAPVLNAIVYRLPYTETLGALPISDSTGNPFHTDHLGYLQGQGQLNLGDQLVALAPISSTGTFTVSTPVTATGFSTLYDTSATPTAAGLSMTPVTALGVQTLTVAPAHPLTLFDLAVSLEWDARPDTQYLNQLQFNLQRASEILFQVTNGQAALGNVKVYFNKDNWDSANVRVYADDRLRPFSSQGGVVTQPITDPVSSAIAYLPGQVSMAATWNRYGNPGAVVGEDWPRTLAHELGHYLFYQDDDYVGLNATGQVIPVPSCANTIMADPYRADYSAFHTLAGWSTDCGSTLANKATGRADWQTVAAFYPALIAPGSIYTGPSSLPLAVTQVSFVDPVTPTLALPDPRFYLNYNGASYQPGTSARAFLFKASGGLVDLGSPVIDQVLARGAEPGDQLCVFEPDAGRQGCKLVVVNDNQQLSLSATTNWQPDLVITPVTTRTVSVSAGNVTGTLTVKAQLFASDQALSSILPLSLVNGVYSGTFNMPGAVLGGYVHVWVDSDPAGNQRASVAAFALGGNPTNQRGGFTSQRGGFTNQRGGFAPVMSGDGQMVLYTTNITFPVGTFYAIQAATYLPKVPGWASVVGKGYRLLASAGAPSLSGASLSLSFATNDVPPNGQTWLQVYYFDGASQSWRALASTVNAGDNSVVAQAQGPGLYALMTAIQIPLYGPGWNLISYPVQATQSVTQALQSIVGHYTTVYGYVVTDTVNPWRMYDIHAPAWANDLVDLQFGQGYWITATDNIVLQLNGAPVVTTTQAGGPQASSGNSQSPPATYYGTVLAGNGFTPTAGMPLTAWVNGVACGQGQTLAVSGQVVYRVHVFADGPGAAGCGAAGRTVTFKVGTRSMATTTPWGNDQPEQLALIAAERLYLPVFMR